MDNQFSSITHRMRHAVWSSHVDFFLATSSVYTMFCRVVRNLHMCHPWTCMLLLPLVLASPRLPRLEEKRVNRSDTSALRRIMGGGVFPGVEERQINRSDFTQPLFKKNFESKKFRDTMLSKLLKNPLAVRLPQPQSVTPRRTTKEAVKKAKYQYHILSEPTVPYRRDFMKFRINSDLRSQLPNISNVRFVLRLRPKPKQMKLIKRQKGSIMKRKIYKNLCKNRNKNSTFTNFESKDIFRKTTELLNNTKICDRLAKLKRIRKLKPRKIRIVVRIFDPIKNEKRQIFFKKIFLKRNIVVSVPVVKEDFAAAAQSENHALVLQIICKKCNRYVRMNRVYKTKKRRTPNKPELNANRAYIMYDTTIKKNAIVHRSKRDTLSPNSCSNLDTSLDRNGDISQDPSFLQCCEQSTYYSFKELGLEDIIVYPRGFYTIDCIGDCSDSEKHLEQSTTETFNIKNATSMSTCVSTTKSSLDILYFVNSHTIIPTRLDDFIGESCGCSSV